MAVGDSHGKLYIFNLNKEGELEDILDSEAKAGIVGAVWDPGHSSRVATIDDLGCLAIWE